MYGRLGRYTGTTAVCLSNGGVNSSNYGQNNSHAPLMGMNKG